MTTLKQIVFASALLFALLTTAAAQDRTSSVTQRSALTNTATATGERERMKIETNGNVGIGTTASADGLSVVGNADFFGGTLTVNKHGNLAANDGQIKLMDPSNSFRGLILGHQQTPGSVFSFFQSAPDGVGFYSDIVIQPKGGNVGIGTTNPLNKLHVEAAQGSAVYGSSPNGSGVEGFSSDGVGVNGNSTNYIGLLGQSNTGIGVEGRGTGGSGVKGFSVRGIGVEGQSSVGNGVSGQSTTAGDGVFGQSDSGRGVYGQSFSGDGVYGRSTFGYAGHFQGSVSVIGNVGIGTGATGVRLQVEGNTLQSIYAHSVFDIGLHARSEQSWAGYFEGTTFFSRSITVDELGSVGGTQLCWNGSHQISFCSSSLRYKTQVQPFLGGLNIINRLRPITFTWREGGARDVGLGAEEVDRVEPLLTFRNQQGEIEGVKYNQLSAVFINAIKQQQQQITQQQAATKQQQDQIAALRTANTVLNARLRLIERTLKNKRGSTRQRR